VVLDIHAKNIHQKKDRFFKKWCRENCISPCRRLKLDLYLLSCIKINSKLIKDLNITSEPLKLLEDNA
jgi:hypothetical protein